MERDDAVRNPLPGALRLVMILLLASDVGSGPTRCARGAGPARLTVDGVTKGRCETSHSTSD